jgi:hypothetical protein
VSGSTSILLLLAAALPHAASAQIGVGLRGGAGWDGDGETVYAGQLELIEFGRWSSVEVGLSALEGGRTERYQGQTGFITHDYREALQLRGLALTAGLLLGHAPKDSRGPYLLLGLGLGPIDVDWRSDSATDPGLGSPSAGGGSFVTEARMIPGAMGTAGLGLRLHRNLDVRAQGTSLIVPSTDIREDMKIVGTLTLTAGITL